MDALHVWRNQHRSSSVHSVLHLSLILSAATFLALLSFFMPDLGVPVLLFLGGLVLVVVSPPTAYYAVIALFFINPGYLPIVVNVGEFTVRIVDFMLIPLIFRFFWSMIAANGRVGIPRVAGPLLIMLGLIGLSVVQVMLTAPARFLISLASYARLLESFMLLPITYVMLQVGRRWERFPRFMIVAGLISVAVGVAEFIRYWSGGSVPLSSIRVEGLLGINSLGLVGGLMLISGVILRRVEAARWSWLAIVVGLTGLVISRSASSIVAAIFSIALYLGSTRLRRTAAFPFKWLSVIALALVMLVVVVWTLRSADVAGLLELEGGSFAKRVYLANLGFQLFLTRPVTGVGWQVSWDPALVGDPQLNAPLRQRYERFPEHYFADVDQTTSVHNMYVQILAELGIVGVIVFLLVAVNLWLIVRGIVSRAPPGREEAIAHIFAWGLLYLLIWWNTNPLYSGQIELVLFFVFLGALAVLNKLRGRMPPSGTVVPTAPP